MRLEARNIRKSYGNDRVLEDISFVVEQGKCLALLGPSGCGKSTLLNILAGLLPADGGSVLCGGEVIEDIANGIAVPARQRRFAMVFQDMSLWAHMTVAENVGFGLDYLRLDRETRERRVVEAMRLLGIHDLRHRLPSMLSGGQQQRVAIGRAIVVEPSVLLMDEPLASLDSRSREELRNEIAALVRRLGITTVYVTHDHTEAMTMAHQVAVMKEGRLEQIASPREVCDRPATTFVASFMGSANFFHYHYELEGVRGPDGKPVFPPHPRTLKRGYLLVRCDDVVILPVAEAAKTPKDGLVRWKGVCIKSVFSGTRHEIHVKTARGEIFRGFVPKPMPPQSEVTVQFDPQRVAFLER